MISCVCSSILSGILPLSLSQANPCAIRGIHRYICGDTIFKQFKVRHLWLGVKEYFPNEKVIISPLVFITLDIPHSMHFLLDIHTTTHATSLGEQGKTGVVFFLLPHKLAPHKFLNAARRARQPEGRGPAPFPVPLHFPSTRLVSCRPLKWVTSSLLILVSTGCSTRSDSPVVIQ